MIFEFRARAFRYGRMVNYQLQFTRDRRALPITRDYMGVEEARLRGVAAEGVRP